MQGRQDPTSLAQSACTSGSIRVLPACHNTSAQAKQLKGHEVDPKQPSSKTRAKAQQQPRHVFRVTGSPICALTCVDACGLPLRLESKSFL